MAATSTPARRLVRTALPVAVVAAAALAAYAGSFGGSFHFDDEGTIVTNRVLRDPELLAAPWRLYALGRFDLLSRWFGYLTFALDLQVHGLDPRGFHVVNFAIHLGASLLVYALVALLFRTPALARSSERSRAAGIALFASCLFAVHPVQTQAVTYIVQRFASLATALGLLSLVLYLSWRLAPADARRGRRAVAYAGAIAASVAAMLTKEMLVTLPVLVALAELLFFEGPLAARLRGLAPLLATAAVAPAIALLAPPMAERIAAGGEQSLAMMRLGRWDFLMTELRVLATYLRLLLWPAGQNLFYDYPIFHSLLDPAVLASALLLAALAALGVALLVLPRRRDPAFRIAGFGIVWFFVAFTIEAGAVVIVDVIYEHRLYYPAVGAFLAVAVLAAQAARALEKRFAWGRTGARAVAVAAIAALAVTTFARNRVWADDVSLWSDVVEKSPRLAAAQHLLGAALRGQRRYPEAEVALRRGLELDPFYLALYRELAQVYAESARPGRAYHALALGEYRSYALAAALASWDRAIALAPADADAHYGRALVLESQGRLAASRDELQLGCRLGSPQACRHAADGSKDPPPP